MRTTDFAKADSVRTIALLPVAAVEKHGLPLSTDAVINEGIVRLMMQRRTRRQTRDQRHGLCHARVIRENDCRACGRDMIATRHLRAGCHPVRYPRTAVCRKRVAAGRSRRGSGMSSPDDMLGRSWLPYDCAHRGGHESNMSREILR